MINFALGEFIMLASKFAATGAHVLGLGWLGGIVFGCAGMTAFAVGLNRWVLRRLIGRPLISFIMVTIGLGIFPASRYRLCVQRRAQFHAGSPLATRSQTT